MQVNIISYQGMFQRSTTAKALVMDQERIGKSVLLVHRSNTTAKAIADVIYHPVLCAYDLHVTCRPKEFKPWDGVLVLGRTTPVGIKGSTRVQVKFRDGTMHNRYAKDLHWGYRADYRSTHIVEYREDVVDADSIAVIDGDLLDNETVDLLDDLGKPVWLIMPQGVLTASSVKEALGHTNLVPPLGPDEEKPKTFACNHYADTCRNCQSMVTQWKADRRDRLAALGG